MLGFSIQTTGNDGKGDRCHGEHTKEKRETRFEAIPYGALDCMCEDQILSNGNVAI